jgi:sporulation protein YlmC with PRC-barrel domain
MNDHICDLHGMQVISLSEGAILGTVSAIHVDPRRKRLAGIAFRGNLRSEHGFASSDIVRQIGRDVISISSEDDAVVDGVGTREHAVNIEDLKGTWVTTLNGRHLGSLVDFDFSPENWDITHLILTGGRRLRVETDR